MVNDNLWVVITTHNRPIELQDLIDDLTETIDSDHIVVIDHQSDPPVQQYDYERLRRDDGEANISRLWNRGLDVVTGLADGQHHVAVLNDDLRITPGTLERLSQVIDVEGVAVAYPDVHGMVKDGDVVVLRRPEPHNLFFRMTGFCFMLNGELGLRADEELVWWFGDDDLEWRAATHGGSAQVGGVTVDHLHPNGSMVNPAFVEQVGRDRETFIRKWGVPPW